MAINLPKRQAPKTQSSVIQWLLDSDPSIRWQVMRDLISSPAEEVAGERARVVTEGAGARLLSLQAATGGGAARHSGVGRLCSTRHRHRGSFRASRGSSRTSHFRMNCYSSTRSRGFLAY